MKIWRSVRMVAFGIGLAGSAISLAGQSGPTIVVDSFVTAIQPRTLVELAEKSDLIVDAHVQAVYPTTEVRRYMMQTDAVFRLDRVIKGVETSQTIVISQYGGKIGNMESRQDHALVDVGQRYLLFLIKWKPGDSHPLPERVMPRYYTMTDHVLVRVQDDKTFLNTRLPFSGPYNGYPLAKMISEVEAHLRLR